MSADDVSDEENERVRAYFNWECSLENPNKRSQASLAREFGINASTLNQFINRKIHSSPTVVRAFRAKFKTEHQSPFSNYTTSPSVHSKYTETPSKINYRTNDAKYIEPINQSSASSTSTPNYKFGESSFRTPTNKNVIKNSSLGYGSSTPTSYAENKTSNQQNSYYNNSSSTTPKKSSHVSAYESLHGNPHSGVSANATESLGMLTKDASRPLASTHVEPSKKHIVVKILENTFQFFKFIFMLLMLVCGALLKVFMFCTDTFMNSDFSIKQMLLDMVNVVSTFGLKLLRFFEKITQSILWLIQNFLSFAESIPSLDPVQKFIITKLDKPHQLFELLSEWPKTTLSGVLATAIIYFCYNVTQYQITTQDKVEERTILISNLESVWLIKLITTAGFILIASGALFCFTKFHGHQHICKLSSEQPLLQMNLIMIVAFYSLFLFEYHSIDNEKFVEDTMDLFVKYMGILLPISLIYLNSGYMVWVYFIPRIFRYLKVISYPKAPSINGFASSYLSNIRESSKLFGLSILLIGTSYLMSDYITSIDIAHHEVNELFASSKIQELILLAKLSGAIVLVVVTSHTLHFFTKLHLYQHIFGVSSIQPLVQMNLIIVTVAYLLFLYDSSFADEEKLLQGTIDSLWKCMLTILPISLLLLQLTYALWNFVLFKMVILLPTLSYRPLLLFNLLAFTIFSTMYDIITNLDLIYNGYQHDMDTIQAYEFIWMFKVIGMVNLYFMASYASYYYMNMHIHQQILRLDWNWSLLQMNLLMIIIVYLLFLYDSSFVNDEKMIKDTIDSFVKCFHPILSIFTFLLNTGYIFWVHVVPKMVQIMSNLIKWPHFTYNILSIAVLYSMDYLVTNLALILDGSQHNLDVTQVYEFIWIMKAIVIGNLILIASNASYYLTGHHIHQQIFKLDTKWPLLQMNLTTIIVCCLLFLYDSSFIDEAKLVEGTIDSFIKCICVIYIVSLIALNLGYVSSVFVLSATPHLFSYMSQRPILSLNILTIMTLYSTGYHITNLGLILDGSQHNLDVTQVYEFVWIMKTTVIGNLILIASNASRYLTDYHVYQQIFKLDTKWPLLQMNLITIIVCCLLFIYDSSYAGEERLIEETMDSFIKCICTILPISLLFLNSVYVSWVYLFLGTINLLKHILRSKTLSAEGYLENENEVKELIKISKILKRKPKECELLEKIGDGGFSSVYKIKYKTQNKTSVDTFAFKQFSISTNALSPSEIDMIEKEIELLGHLEHENIVKIIGAIGDPDATDINGGKMGIGIVMEYCENGSLRSLLNKEMEMSMNLIVHLLHGTAQGLEYLHSYIPHSIIHGDIKSDNILIDKEYNAKLCDFGISKLQRSTSASTKGGGSMIGTLAYKAPETFDEKAGLENDVYSFGCVILELLTGERPWSELDNDIGKIYAKVVARREKHSLSNVRIDTRKELLDLMKRCLDYDKDNRPKMNEVRMQLEKMMNNAVLIELDGKSNEFNKVENLFFPGGDKEGSLNRDTYRIVKIDKIRHSFAEGLYDQEREKIRLMISKLGLQSNINERMLFHGTRKKDPMMILNHPDAFMKDHADEKGFYGRGLYFAELARYSNAGYQYNIEGTNQHQILVCSVVCGNAKEYGLQTNKDLSQKDLGTNHHSIHAGPHGGDINNTSCMYVVYKDTQILPKYLITYEST